MNTPPILRLMVRRRSTQRLAPSRIAEGRGSRSRRARFGLSTVTAVAITSTLAAAGWQTGVTNASLPGASVTAGTVQQIASMAATSDGATSSVKVSWPAVSGATSLKVYKSTDSAQTWQAAGTAAPGDTSWTDGSTAYCVQTIAGNWKSAAPSPGSCPGAPPNAGSATVGAGGTSATTGLTCVFSANVSCAWTPMDGASLQYLWTSTDNGATWTKGLALTGTNRTWQDAGTATTWYFLQSTTTSPTWSSPGPTNGSTAGAVQPRAEGANTLVASGLPSGNKIAYGPDGNLYSFTSAGTGVVKIALPGGAVSTVAGVTFPSARDLTFGPDGMLYITTSTGLYKADLTAGTASLLGSAWTAGTSSALAFGPDGTLYVAYSYGTIPQLVKVNTTTGATTSLNGGVGATDGTASSMAFGANGYLYLKTYGATDGHRMWRINPSTGAFTGASTSGQGSCITFGPDGIGYMPEVSTGFRVLDFSAGTFRNITGPSNVNCAVYGPDGYLYAISTAKAIYKVAP